MNKATKLYSEGAIIIMNTQMVISFTFWAIVGINSQRSALREESSQTNVILQYKLLAYILSAVCSVIQ